MLLLVGEATLDVGIGECPVFSVVGHISVECVAEKYVLGEFVPSYWKEWLGKLVRFIYPCVILKGVICLISVGETENALLSLLCNTRVEFTSEDFTTVVVYLDRLLANPVGDLYFASVWLLGLRCEGI